MITLIPLIHISESGNSASGEMTYGETISYIAKFYGPAFVAEIAAAALVHLGTFSVPVMLGVLDANTEGKWQAVGI